MTPSALRSGIHITDAPGCVLVGVAVGGVAMLTPDEARDLALALDLAAYRADAARGELPTAEQGKAGVHVE